jgi:carbon storage regulator
MVGAILVLTRRIGESIMIGDDIKVFVTGINGDQVRIGIEAPRGIVVDRSEIRARRDAGKIQGDP